MASSSAQRLVAPASPAPARAARVRGGLRAARRLRRSTARPIGTAARRPEVHAAPPRATAGCCVGTRPLRRGIRSRGSRGATRGAANPRYRALRLVRRVFRCRPRRTTNTCAPRSMWRASGSPSISAHSSSTSGRIRCAKAGLWTLPASWTPRSRPLRLGKRVAFSTAFTVFLSRSYSSVNDVLVYRAVKDVWYLHFRPARARVGRAEARRHLGGPVVNTSELWA